MVARKEELSFYDFGSRDYDPASDSLEDVRCALRELFEAVASDLGVDDMSAPEFVQYARDCMCDRNVPVAIRDAVVGKR